MQVCNNGYSSTYRYQLFSWIATMWGGSIEFKTRMLFAIGRGVILLRARLTDSWDLCFAWCQLGSHLGSLHNLSQLLDSKCQTACDGLRQLLLQRLVNGQVLQGCGGCDAQDLDTLQSTAAGQ